MPFKALKPSVKASTFPPVNFYIFNFMKFDRGRGAVEKTASRRRS
jgi:hypothetical protein